MENNFIYNIVILSAELLSVCFLSGIYFHDSKIGQQFYPTNTKSIFCILQEMLAFDNYNYVFDLLT